MYLNSAMLVLPDEDERVAKKPPDQKREHGAHPRKTARFCPEDVLAGRLRWHDD